MSRVVVMGVTGCGKSTVGALVADHLDVPFGDGDDFHSPANVAKMTAGEALTDDDRWPWLRDIGRWLADHPEGAVVACSALKRAYRDVITAAAPDAVFVHLSAPQSVLEERVRERAQREGHFAGPGLLDSQYEALEGPSADERAFTVDVAQMSPQEAAEISRQWLHDV